MAYNKEANIFKAMSDTIRIEIIHMLSNGSLCACKILESLSITQPTLSYHMKILCECGLVKCKKVGVWNHYSIDKSVVVIVSNYIDELVRGL